MVDKIDNSGLTQPRRLESSSQRGSVETREQGSVSDDQALPRSRAEATTTYERLQQAVGGAGEIDREKVAEIKAAIGRGEYTLDAGRVATAIVNLEQLLAS